MGVGSIKKNRNNAVTKFPLKDIEADKFTTKDNKEYIKQNLTIQDSSTQPDLYLSLINSDISLFNKICENGGLKDENTKEILFKYPSCLVRSVYQHFKCNSTKIKPFLKKLSFNHTCVKDKDYKKLHKFVDCNGISRRLFNQTLYNHHFGNEISKYELRLIWSMQDLCSNDKYFEKALCAAYEFRDEISGKYFYLKIMGDASTCPNKRFKERLDKLSKIINLVDENYTTPMPLNNPSRIVRSVPIDLKNGGFMTNKSRALSFYSLPLIFFMISIYATKRFSKGTFLSLLASFLIFYLFINPI